MGKPCISRSSLGLQAPFWLQLLFYDFKSGDFWGVGCQMGGGSSREFGESRFPGVEQEGSRGQGVGARSRAREEALPDAAAGVTEGGNLALCHGTLPIS